MKWLTEKLARHSKMAQFRIGANNSNLSVLARSGMLDTEGNGAIASFGHTHINDQGTIVTRINLRATALDSLDDEGLFRVDNSGLIRVVREGDIAPDGQNRIFIEREQFALNNAGTVAFNARLYAQGNQFFGTQAILVHDRGQTTEVVKAGDASPSANGTFSDFSAPFLNDSGDVFFSAVIEESQSPPNAPSQSFRLPSLDSPEFDNVADINLPQRVHGIYRAHSDQITEIVRTGDPTPEGRDEFLGLTALHANDAGVVAFGGFYRESAVSNENGIYLGDGIDTVKVARIGDQLGGREIYSIRVLQEPDTGASSLNRHGELLLDIGTTSDQAAESGLYRFVPELHWRGIGSGEWDTSTDTNENARTNWTLSLIPAAVHDVLIDPEIAVTVLGPNSETHVKSLVVGSGAGAAVLQLANGTIEAKQGVSIAMNGVLAGSGELVGQVAVAGTLSPGNSIGKIAIDGDLSLDDTARTLIEIDYLRDIESSDRIDVTGFVELGGLLEIHLLNWSFENSPREFLIFSANGLQGEFAEITVFEAPHLSARFHNDGQRFFVSVSAVPLPPAAWLFTTGVLTILGWRRKSF